MSTPPNSHLCLDSLQRDPSLSTNSRMIAIPAHHIEAGSSITSTESGSSSSASANPLRDTDSSQISIAPPSSPNHPAPPAYSEPNIHPSIIPGSSSWPQIDLYGSSSCSREDLPVYAPQNETEPQTLARGLWRWGWALPLLWLIGMCILWIPLKPVEEESDPEKAQKLEEMITILRKTELKYAKRCFYGVIGWSIIIALIVLIAVLINLLA